VSPVDYRLRVVNQGSRVLSPMQPLEFATLSGFVVIRNLWRLLERDANERPSPQPTNYRPSVGVVVAVRGETSRWSRQLWWMRKYQRLHRTQHPAPLADKRKTVVNLSNVPLEDVAYSVYGKGLNCVVSPAVLCIEDFISGVEKAVGSSSPLRWWHAYNVQIAKTVMFWENCSAASLQ
jgi:hypothetical protein